MSSKRRRFSAAFKFQVALEAAKGTKTLNGLSSEYSVHPNQISGWKREPLESGETVFSNNGARQQRAQEARRTELYEQFLAALPVVGIRRDRCHDVPGCIVPQQCLPRLAGVRFILADPWSEEWGSPHCSTNAQSDVLLSLLCQ